MGHTESEPQPQATKGAGRQEEPGMYEVAWMEITKKFTIVTKRKAFATERARDNFIQKLFDSGNLYQLLGTR